MGLDAHDFINTSSPLYHVWHCAYVCTHVHHLSVIYLKMKRVLFYSSVVHIVKAKLGHASAGDEVKLMMKHAHECIRTSNPVIRSPARQLGLLRPPQRFIFKRVAICFIFLHLTSPRLTGVMLHVVLHTSSHIHWDTLGANR